MARREERTGDPIWREYRQQPGGFGSVVIETQVVQGPTPPAGATILDPSTPLHSWEAHAVPQPPTVAVPPGGAVVPGGEPFTGTVAGSFGAPAAAAATEEEG